MVYVPKTLAWSLGGTSRTIYLIAVPLKGTNRTHMVLLFCPRMAASIISHTPDAPPDQFSLGLSTSLPVPTSARLLCSESWPPCTRARARHRSPQWGGGSFRSAAYPPQKLDADTPTDRTDLDGVSFLEGDHTRAIHRDHPSHSVSENREIIHRVPFRGVALSPHDRLRRENGV